MWIRGGGARWCKGEMESASSGWQGPFSLRTDSASWSGQLFVSMALRSSLSPDGGKVRSSHTLGLQTAPADIHNRPWASFDINVPQASNSGGEPQARPFLSASLNPPFPECIHFYGLHPFTPKLLQLDGNVSRAYDDSLPSPSSRSATYELRYIAAGAFFEDTWLGSVHASTLKVDPFSNQPTLFCGEQKPESHSLTDFGCGRRRVLLQLENELAVG